MQTILTTQELNDLAAKLGENLQQKCWVLACAESCTGGMVAQAITSVAGSSAWFDRGFVTYSNEAKIEMLGVLPKTLEKHGAVSEQTAVEMVRGCFKIGVLSNSHAQLAGSITGIAGPDGGSADKPVGTVCFAWAILNKPVSVTTQHFTGNRQQIRQQAAAYLMQQLILVIN